MDKKVTRRIIGVLVMIALVIIVLPLIINGRSVQSSLQTAEMKAPPFPEPQNETDPIPTTMIVKNNPVLSAPQPLAKNNAVLPFAQHIEKNMPVIAVTSSTIKKSIKPDSPVVPVKTSVVSTNAIVSKSSVLPSSQTSSVIQSVTAPEKPQAIKTEVAAVAASASLTPAVNQPTMSVAAVEEKSIEHEAATQLAFPATPMITTALEAKDEIDKAQQLVISSAQADNQRAVAVSSNGKVASGHAENVLVVDAQGGVKEVLVGTPAPVSPAAMKAAIQTTVAGSMRTAGAKMPVVSTKTPTKKVAIAKTMHIPASVPAAAISENLGNLKKSAWVVQMGSFRNKGNALRLTNALRAKGYKAFTFETKSNGQTRVYVGPEFKQASASILVNRIKNEINLHGVIVAYNPLEL